MRIILVGGSGTIGREVAAALRTTHEVIVAARNSGDLTVDMVFGCISS